MYNSTYVDFENEQNLLLMREVSLVVSAEKQGHQGAFWGYWKCSVAWQMLGYMDVHVCIKPSGMCTLTTHMVCLSFKET